MGSRFTGLLIMFVSAILFSSSTAFAGAINDFKKDYCVYGTGTTAASHKIKIILTDPSGDYQDCGGGSVAITNPMTTTQVVAAFSLAINDNCGFNGRAEAGATFGCFTNAGVPTSPPSIPLRIVTLMSDFDLAIEKVALSNVFTPVLPGVPVKFNPVVYTPEPSSTLLLSAGVLGLLGLARQRISPRRID